MTDFYTNAITYGNNILVRGYRDGVPFRDKIDYSPTLYVKSNKPTKFKTIYGEFVDEIKPGSIRDARDFFKQYEHIHGFSIYGMADYNRQYISDNYAGDIKYQFNLLKIYSIDIETETEYGFPDVKTANEQILLISLTDKQTKRKITFGSKPWGYTPPDDVIYNYCSSEKQLLKEFLLFWQSNYPDIITGWNIARFDIPYLVRRINVVLGEDYSRKLSPWNKLRERIIFNNDNEELVYNINGISTLDYIDLYKKFTYITQESYKLDHIVYVELGENKRDNPGTSFKDFYTNWWDEFVDYNIHDAVLVDKLDDKLKLLELAVALSYYAKINFEDVFSPVGMWDAIIYNYLRSKDIVIPPKNKTGRDEEFEGAFVREPVTGYHKWIASFDLNSLYPHLIMMYNLSPETITDIKVPTTVRQLLSKEIDTNYVKQHGVSMSGNGWCYRKDIRGFLAELMETMYTDRSKHKKTMLKVEQEYENTKDKSLINEISRLDNLQMALKSALTSLYGALGNQWFRYYDLRIAEGITQSGQLSIQWIANKLDIFMNNALKTNDVPYTIYSDTDSIYLTLEKLVETVCPNKTIDQKISYMDRVCEEIIQPTIDAGYQELAEYMNAYSQKMIMKREVLADKGIFVAKKMYILNVHNSEGVQFATPKLKVKGLAMVRSSTPAVVRDKLKESIMVILEGNQEKLHDFIRNYKKEFDKLPVEAISSVSGVNGMNKYGSSLTIYNKGTPINVRGSLLFNHHVKRLNLTTQYQLISDGDKIKYVYVEKPNPFHEDVISFSSELPKEFDLHRYIDYNKQFNKVFVKAVENIITALGWTINTSATLDEFF